MTVIQTNSHVIVKLKGANIYTSETTIDKS